MVNVDMIFRFAIQAKRLFRVICFIFPLVSLSSLYLWRYNQPARHLMLLFKFKKFLNWNKKQMRKKINKLRPLWLVIEYFMACIGYSSGTKNLLYIYCEFYIVFFRCRMKKNGKQHKMKKPKRNRTRVNRFSGCRKCI